ncbi:protein phosphatase 1 regulatory subunit 15A [Dendropsophus ebraccatus]|uniref:protein phosphatase 1 regulatory subunit 15A n=1 Tax=Dendropsophus ebraccatus TaxID=150705 RepID=UPI0038322B1B
MGFDYLNFCSYWCNLTLPRTCCYRGTAFQFDLMKNYPQTQIVLTDLGADVVLVTMAARIVQSMMSLGKNLLQKRALYWRMLPRDCVSKAVRAAVWVCWSVLDLLLPVLMTTVYVYRNQSRFNTVCHSEQPMNTVTIKCHWGSGTVRGEKMVDDLCNLNMAGQEIPKMELDYECDKMDSMLNKEVLLPSCTNPVILSMICMPSEQTDSSESDGSEVDSVEGLDGECSQEDMSVDSGMQESWTPKSKYEDDCDEESDWSDEESWDEESNVCNDDNNEDLWASFCRSDDPYNPLSFAMPARSPEQPKKEAPKAVLDSSKVVPEKIKLRKKPVLSGFKSSHKCTLLKEEAKEGDQCTKKVRFSPKVTVHPIVTWSFAHRMARRGPWEEYARDRCRFQKRIAETEAAIGFCLDPYHREKIRARLQSQQN